MSQWWEQYKVDLPLGKVGNVEVVHIKIDEDMARFSQMRALFQGGRGQVWPGTYTGIELNGRLWMSDTPDEIADHLPALHRAEEVGGRVLVNGLGLGMVVKALLAMDNVEHVDVVEINPQVVELVGPHYACERLTIHQDNAYTIEWPEEARWAVIWSDIWPTICTDNLGGIQRLRTKYAERCDWHGFWSEDLIYEKWPDAVEA